MSLVELLESLGDRLGIIEKPAEGNAPKLSKIRTRTVTLAELMTEIRSEEVRALADAPAELTVPFEKVFEAAGVRAPEGGWSIDQLRRLLESEPFKGRERSEVQKQLLDRLAAEKVETERLLKDAVARDQALDAFEAFARKKMQERMAVRERTLAELEVSLEELQKQRAQIREQMTADSDAWRGWRERKRAEERSLAWAVGFLIDRTIITTDDGD